MVRLRLVLLGGGSQNKRTTATKHTATARMERRFDGLTGMSRDAYRAAVEAQKKRLPAAHVVPGHNAVARRIGELLKLAELKRVGEKQIPLWPAAWEQNSPAEWLATNAPLDLYVVNRKTKGEPEPVPNANYGRFYVARFIPKQDPETGLLVRGRGGMVEEQIDSFRWFEQTDFVTSGALRKLAPGLEALLTRKPISTLDTTPFFPHDLLGQLYLSGKDDKTILKEWAAAEVPDEIFDVDMDEA